MKHLLCYLYDGDASIEDERRLKNAFVTACHKSNNLILSINDHSFYPQGYSLIVLLAESHAAIHTYPEDHFATVDYFSCSPSPKINEFIYELEKWGYNVEIQEIVDRIRKNKNGESNEY